MFEAHRSVTTVVAHRWEVLRQGLASILRQSWPDWHVVETGDCETVIDLAANESVELLVIDRDLPGLGDPKGIARLRDAGRTQRLVIVADIDHPEDVLECLFAGANGYVSTGSTTFQFVTCVETALAGGTYAPSSLVQSAQRTPYAALSPESVADGGFTERQREVLQLLREGLSTKSIARRLDLSVGTVKVHLASVYRHLGVHSRLEAVAQARALIPSVTDASRETRRQISGTAWRGRSVPRPGHAKVA